MSRFGAGGGGQKWKTLWSCDFRTLAPVGFTYANGIYSMGGQNWELINAGGTADFRRGFEVTNASGLRMRTDYLAGNAAGDSDWPNYTAPVLRLPIASLSTKITASTPLRVTMYVGNQADWRLWSNYGYIFLY
jgi:hypothetical protein